MAYKAQYGGLKFAERIEALDFYFLVGLNLKKIIDKLGEGLQPGGIPNAEKLISFYLLTKNYENIITMFLPKEYWKAKERIFPQIPPMDFAWKDIKKNLKFFDSVSQWFQLIHTFAYNEGVLKLRRPYVPDEPGEVYKDGFVPDDYKKS